MRKMRRITRRQALTLSAAATALPLVHIRTAGAAGKVAIGFWDHWVPAGNEIMRKQVQAWAEKNKVEVQIDFITSVGNKILLTAAAEQQAKTGHDVMTFRDWSVQNHAETLEPLDDVMKQLIGRYGPVNPISTYLGTVDGHWVGLPTSTGTNYKGPCARISVLRDKAGIDVTAMYPARSEQTALAKEWTYEAHLKAAEACQKAGMTFGIGLGVTADSVDTAGALFHAYGADLIDASGNMRVKSDAVRQVLEHAQKLVKFLPADAVSYDDASNNRALISGRSALIWNPPSAWAVAKRDAPQIAADCWTFPAPAGPNGRFTPAGPWFWGLWQFSKNKTASKELMTWLAERPQVEERCTVIEGFDVPPFQSMTDFQVWENVEPPKGTLYSYPLRSYLDNQAYIAGYPAPPAAAVQIYQRGTMPTMMAMLQRGESIPRVIAWAEEELAGFSR
jgi:ABC-type glycerol-3-phosphate transport system substrate-binding protein